MPALTIDHVTIASSALAPMRQTFAKLGLATDYGGPHSNGLTHMALLGFDDGSYIELISSLKPGQLDEAFWGKHIIGDGGACAWAVQVDDVAAEAARLTDLAIPVQGPKYYHRRRPDGTLVEWNLAFLGDKGAGAQLPFIIKDITRREWRVRPSASVTGGLLTGVAVVILGVKNFDEAVTLFRQVYSWDEPSVVESEGFGAQLAYFMDTPVMLATPLEPDNWLAQRLGRFDESPCAYLLGTSDFERVRENYQLIQLMQFFDRPVAWFDPNRLNGFQLGVIG